MSTFKHKPELISKQTKKVFLPRSSKKSSVVEKEPKRHEELYCRSEIKKGPRVNDLNIQMLSRTIYDQVFKGINDNKLCPNRLEDCQKELLKHGMVKSSVEYMPDVDFKIPKLNGNNIIEHFYNIGEAQAKPYRDLVLTLLKSVPEVPKVWVMQLGWTRYAPNCEPEQVTCPLEDCIVFDVEVCVQVGKMPILATAVSNVAWYGWVSESLIDGTEKPIVNNEYFQEDLIPLYNETNLNTHKVAIGHNVCYDRARIKEQYLLNNTALRFLDTMSLHISISGVTSYQRAVLKSQDKSDEDETWLNCSSLNSLKEVYKLYCGKEIDKDVRDLFVEGSLADVREQFHTAISYCAQDVLATYEVLKVMFPLFLERFPHPVTFAGMLELGTAYLPINSNWVNYINNSESAYEDLDIERKIILTRCADQACQLLHDEKYMENLWMWDQDWEVKDLRIRKTASKVDSVVQDEGYLHDTSRYLPAVPTLLPGYPNWYRKLCTKPDSSEDWIPGPQLISTSMQITPKLLGLTWEGYPLHFIRGKGWGLIVPFVNHTDLETKIPLRQLLDKCPALTGKPQTSVGFELKIEKEVEQNLSKQEFYKGLKKDKTEGLYKGSGVWSNVVLDDCCWFFKLPHKDGPSHRVGNPLAKDFLNKFSESVLAGDTENAEKVLSIQRKLSYWRNNRSRIMEQMVVWINRKFLPKQLRNSEFKFGAILPQVVVTGTLTRRAVEPTWMTASNAHPERVGSELRSMVQAPPGYNIVGGDVDSQELWIASVIGDANFASIHGGTPLGWMTISGNKSDGTDMHSVTAKAIGISRDQAKVINYARIYGAGQNFAEQLLKQFNPTMSESEVRSKATKMFALTKGKRVYYLKKEYLLDFPDKAYGRWQAFEIAKLHGKKIDEMFIKAKWVGGTESAMFNRLEEIANQSEPVTPFLGCRLSRALEPKTTLADRFLPTRVNWVVQSGAVDFLHLMLVCMRWLMQDRARFCLSFHDEVRYLVHEEYKYQAALAMHVTNLLTRSFCSVKLGIKDLPQSIAFFSSVEVDTVLRKESKQDCKTPSNPHGLHNGYGIPNGESLDIYQAIDKAGGKYVWWNNMSRATKRKHVLMEVMQDDFSPPTEHQQIVKVISSKGNNLHEVESTEGTTFLVSMPTKFRKNVWVKRGDFVLVEPIEEGDKVKAEMVRVLTNDHIKYFIKDGVWPDAFSEAISKKPTDDDELFMNTNRRITSNDETDSDSDNDSDSSD
ncbi:hypothetical protein FQR65_LT06302 [Abscondita terminalis]|nr:hypothetical protein FQR65_LT06302 [Abscondita terminalis]